MADDSKVVAMPGYAVPRSQADPVEEVVAMCEELLDLARTGVLRGLGAAMIVADPQLRTEASVFALPSPDRYAMIAAVRLLTLTVDQGAWPDLADCGPAAPSAG